MVILYCGEWRGIPLHNVYWSKSNCRTATCVITIIDSRSDKNYTACLWSNLTLIFSKWHTRLSTRFRKPPFDLHGLLITFIYSVSVSVFYWRIQFPFFRISNSIHWIKIFLFFLFRQTDCRFTSSLSVKKLKTIFHFVIAQRIWKKMSGSET
jgi:hypothetical protein